MKPTTKALRLLRQANEALLKAYSELEAAMEGADSYNRGRIEATRTACSEARDHVYRAIGACPQNTRAS